MRIVAKLSFSAVLVLVILALAGCSLADPARPGDSLLIGRLTLVAEGWSDTFTGTTVNGTQKVSVMMSLRNQDTQKLYRIITDPNGLFGVRNPESGDYLIEKLTFKATGSSGWSQLTAKGAIPLPRIAVRPGQVINLGFLCWIANNTTKEYRLVQNGSPEELKRLFAEKLPKSQWLQREWVDVAF